MRAPPLDMNLSESTTPTIVLIAHLQHFVNRFLWWGVPIVAARRVACPALLSG